VFSSLAVDVTTISVEIISVFRSSACVTFVAVVVDFGIDEMVLKVVVNVGTSLWDNEALTIIVLDFDVVGIEDGICLSAEDTCIVNVLVA